MRGPRLALLALLLLPAGLIGASGPRPLISALSTCSALTSATTPADSVTWFDPARHQQVVFFAHWLVPLEPRSDEAWQAGSRLPWHPPQVLAAPGAKAVPAGKGRKVTDAFYAEAIWTGPDGSSLARFGLTLPARAVNDQLLIEGRRYIPHTFAMAVGIKDIRHAAGQLALPDKAGQYHIRFLVDGGSLGLAFFRMLLPGPAKAPSPVATPSPPPK